jgi:hypothetical protein
MADKPNLSPGQSSDWVRYLQQMINHHYRQSVVPESGEFDGTTADTVRYLRQQNGLRDTADVDGEVWALLEGQVGSRAAGAATAVAAASPAAAVTTASGCPRRVSPLDGCPTGAGRTRSPVTGCST